MLFGGRVADRSINWPNYLKLFKIIISRPIWYIPAAFRYRKLLCAVVVVPAIEKSSADTVVAVAGKTSYSVDAADVESVVQE